MWKTERDDAIRVCVRVRPLNMKEKESSKNIADVSMKHNTITIRDPKDEAYDPVGTFFTSQLHLFFFGFDDKLSFISTSKSFIDHLKHTDVLHRSYEKSFAFQKVFDTTCDQSRIHKETTSGLAEFVCRGNHASVFAYGATGSGKTYTLGLERPSRNRNEEGVIVRVLNELFGVTGIGSKRVIMSYMEIYNETIRDLLVKRSKKLPLRAAGEGNVEVAGLSTYRIRHLGDAMRLLMEGNSRRKTEGTAANSVSSRSHAILTIRIGPKSKLNFIDLAGSERASQTQNRNTRLHEGARINRSLLSLANCINAIIANQKRSRKKKRHVPYRDSKLTRVLRDSLAKSGCRTIMIATVRPHRDSFRDTLNTLKYASRASSIRKSVAREAIAASRRRVRFPEIVSLIEQQQNSIAVPKRVAMRRKSRDRDDTSFDDSMGSIFCKTPAPPSMSPTKRCKSNGKNRVIVVDDADRRKRATRGLTFQDDEKSGKVNNEDNDDDDTPMSSHRRVVHLSDSHIIVNRAELIAMRDRIDAILNRNHHCRVVM